MEKSDEDGLNLSTLMKIYYKPEFSNLFSKIKDIKTPVKNDILIALLDGQWHSERELIKIAKKKFFAMGSVTLSSMIHALNNIVKSDYLEKKHTDSTMYYKISENYIGLSRAAFTRFRFMK